MPLRHRRPPDGTSVKDWIAAVRRQILNRTYPTLIYRHRSN